MKREWLFAATLTVLAVIYAIYFTGRFKTPTIQIFHTYRNIHPRRQNEGMIPSLIFGLNRQLRLTEIKVVPRAEYRTNVYTLALWHLVSDSNSVPVKTFYYGQFIRGLKPAISGILPEPLEPDVTYELIVTAGKSKGEHDFHIK